MQRLAYVIVSTALIVGMLLVGNINTDRSEHIPETSTPSSEETVDADSQVIEESNQETNQEEVVDELEVDISSEITTSDQVEYPAPHINGEFKSYTNYQLLNHNSPQWTQIQCHPDAYTDINGLRKVGEYYCVAMGSYYAEQLGDIFEIQTEYGSFKVIICDFKDDCHTDVNNQYTISNGCVVEFYVDMGTFSSYHQSLGDVSYVDTNFQGKILSVIKLGSYFGE